MAEEEKEEPISAFAFRMGREIEKAIDKRTNDLHHKNQMLEAKILTYYLNTKDEKFREYFGIVKS